MYTTHTYILYINKCATHIYILYKSKSIYIYTLYIYVNIYTINIWCTTYIYHNHPTMWGPRVVGGKPLHPSNCS